MVPFSQLLLIYGLPGFGMDCLKTRKLIEKEHVSPSRLGVMSIYGTLLGFHVRYYSLMWPLYHIYGVCYVYYFLINIYGIMIISINLDYRKYGIGIMVISINLDYRKYGIG
jgi:hypothetical protein